MAAPTQETVTTFASLLKEYYTGDKVEEMTYATNPLLAIMPKMTEFYGKTLPIPIIYGTTQGSATFSVAVANKSSSQSKEFQLTRANDYSLASIGREAVMASESDRGAFLEAAKVNIDGAIRCATRSLAISAYRKGSGRRGKISAGSDVTTATITLNDINDITNFEVFMTLQLSATDGTGTVRTGTAQIAAVDRSAGTITFSAALNTFISAAAVNDYIFRQGDYALVPTGLEGWIPPFSARSTSAGTDSFFGVDRFADWVRLGGTYHDGTAQSIEEALMDGQSKVAREGGVISHAFCNNSQYRQLLKSLSSKVFYKPTTVEATATIAFSGIRIEGDAGAFDLIPDPNCPSSVIYLLQMNTWKHYSLGAAPDIFDRDTDQEMLRESGTDGYEVRVGSYSNFGCRAPGWNGRIELNIAT